MKQFSCVKKSKKCKNIIQLKMFFSKAFNIQITVKQNMLTIYNKNVVIFFQYNEKLFVFKMLKEGLSNLFYI